MFNGCGCTKWPPNRSHGQEPCDSGCFVNVDARLKTIKYVESRRQWRHGREKCYNEHVQLRESFINGGSDQIMHLLTPISAYDRIWLERDFSNVPYSLDNDCSYDGVQCWLYHRVHWLKAVLQRLVVFVCSSNRRNKVGLHIHGRKYQRTSLTSNIYLFTGSGIENIPNTAIAVSVGIHDAHWGGHIQSQSPKWCRSMTSYLCH